VPAKRASRRAAGICPSVGSRECSTAAFSGTKIGQNRAPVYLQSSRRAEQAAGSRTWGEVVVRAISATDDLHDTRCPTARSGRTRAARAHWPLESGRRRSRDKLDSLSLQA
jgi:hypothetical protein